jgi:hypothetical protein
MLRTRHEKTRKRQFRTIRKRKEKKWEAWDEGTDLPSGKKKGRKTEKKEWKLGREITKGIGKKRKGTEREQTERKQTEQEQKEREPERTVKKRRQEMRGRVPKQKQCEEKIFNEKAEKHWELTSAGAARIWN